MHNSKRPLACHRNGIVNAATRHLPCACRWLSEVDWTRSSHRLAEAGIMRPGSLQ
ncbi:hypothetical protein QFZ34_000369 [Phyllobacterium ifriqiyense]|uniref:Uncharacterized protein n=1 Tax=Phyllobacterium ifriqiyense TaxID=314238 RepID=A0ABU0S351_9HYPH|nr:hypothetical protein [Phyllobacterium ifriqiyense]